MQRLTKEQAGYCIAEACIMVAEYQNSKYRFGQALFNALPVDLYHYFKGSEHDFFYWTNNDKVIETFWEHYVEKEEE